jgi:phage replication-related protein YjqB (UPF0714/DUF867 family)
MVDKYRSFAELSAHETKGVDFRIRAVRKESAIVVLAPHGGEIEPGTSEIASAIAGADLSFYCFEGIIPGRPHGDLHIKSGLFDETQCCELVASADLVIAIHRRMDEKDPETVSTGGRDTLARDRIVEFLQKAGFKAEADDKSSISGTDPRNICNRGRRKAGVQLELPRSLRDRLLKDRAMLKRFVRAIRNSLTPSERAAKR